MWEVEEQERKDLGSLDFPNFLDLGHKHLRATGLFADEVSRQQGMPQTIPSPCPDLHVLLLEDLLVLLQRQDEKLLLKCHSKTTVGSSDSKQTFSPVLKLNAVLIRSVATGTYEETSQQIWGSGTLKDLPVPLVFSSYLTQSKQEDVVQYGAG
jgi:hypothetical protein